MPFKKPVQGIVALAGYLGFALLGGCEWQASGAQQGDKADAGVAWKSHCTDKVSSCRLNCFKADLGSACSNCCDRNGVSCDRGEGYSFNVCQNL